MQTKIKKGTIDETCCFCKKTITSIFDNHSARPLKDGSCCTSCNTRKVIPARMKLGEGYLENNFRIA